VHWSKKQQKWCAKISINGTLITLGYFDYLSVAFWVYAEAAHEHFGKFARFD
jgi:hypothetical protein